MPVYKFANYYFFVEIVSTVPADDDLYYEPNVVDYYYITKGPTKNHYFCSKKCNNIVSAAVAKRISKLQNINEINYEIILNGEIILSDRVVQNDSFIQDELIEEPVYLAWSGGWDSTFRLCELIFIEKRVVQPIYIIFSTKQGQAESFIEIEQNVQQYLWSLIKNLIFKLENTGTLLPIKNYLDSDFTTFQKLYRYYTKYTPAPPYRVSMQYYLIVLCMRYYNIPTIEIAVEKNIYSVAYHTEYVMQNCKYIGEKHQCRQIDDKFGLLGCRYPICHINKRDMEKIASKHNFINVLLHTWTCRNPVQKEPGIFTCCKTCHACQEMVAEDQGYRLNYVFNNLLAGLLTNGMSLTNGKMLSLDSCLSFDSHN